MSTHCSTPRFPNPGFQVFSDLSVPAHPTPYYPNPDPYTIVGAGAQGSHTQDHSWSDRDRSPNRIQFQEMIKGQDILRMNVNVPEFVPRFPVLVVTFKIAILFFKLLPFRFLYCIVHVSKHLFHAFIRFCYA